MNADSELPIFVYWFEFVNWFLPLSDKLPKKVRFSITQRMCNLVLDIVEDLTEARYSRDKMTTLRAANLKLEKLRILLRLSVEQKFVAQKSYQYAIKRINETGKMLGGWIKSQEQRT
jgi:hypothetical protein